MNKTDKTNYTYIYIHIFIYIDHGLCLSIVVAFNLLFCVDNILDVVRIIKPMGFNSPDSLSQVGEAAATVFSTKKIGK